MSESNPSKWDLMSAEERDAVIREQSRRLGELFDEIDAAVRQPGEESLRTAVARQARALRTEGDT